MKSDFIDNRRDRGNTASMTTESTPQSIRAVARALAGLIETGDVDALEPLLSDGLRPSPAGLDLVDQGREWLAAVARPLVPLAGMRVEIHHLLADGDHVVMHSRRRLPDGGPEIAVVDIWRIDDGLIAEAWEIIEPVAQAAANLTWWDA